MPVPPPTPSSNSGLSAGWIVGIVVICAVVIAGIAFGLYYYKVKQMQAQVRGSNVVYGTDQSGRVKDIPAEEKQLLEA